MSQSVRCLSEASINCEREDVCFFPSDMSRLQAEGGAQRTGSFSYLNACIVCAV